jgi:hypothetical protein
MRDHFQWFDPWDSHEQQRDYGRRDVLDLIVEEALPDFREALARRTQQLAADLAERVLEPKMRERLASVRSHMELERALSDRILHSVAPELQIMLQDLSPRLDIDEGFKGTAVAIVSARQTFYVDRHEAFVSRDWR